MNFMKKNGLAIGSSFFIPVLIVAISYFRIGIYPSSELTILSSDGFSQLVNFYASFNNTLHGEQSLFYSWSGSLGINSISLMSYYINSIFSFIVFFFDNINMPDAMYVIFLTKIGAMGVSLWVYAYNTYRLAQWKNIALSIFYALTSFTIAYSIFLMWMDALIYLPLILLGIHRLMDGRKPTLLFISYFLLFVSNYYIAFMVGIFSFLYYFARFFTDSKRYRGSFFSYLLTSLLAGGASMVIILPSVIDLRTNGEKLDTISQFFTRDMGAWDLVVKSMPGVYDTSKYGSAPFIYVGLLPLMFCIFYFVSKKIPLKNKLIYGSLLLLLSISFYVEPLNLFWQGLHAPNMFLFRFSFLFSALVIILAGFGMEKFEKKDLNVLLNINFVLGGIYLAAILLSNKKRYDYITQDTLIVTFALLIVYLLLFFAKDSGKKGTWIIPYIVLICIGIETLFNTHQLFLGIKAEWSYVPRKAYEKPYKDISSLVSKTQNENEQFYRLENIDPVTRTDNFNYNYSGITMFSSVRNRNSSQYLNILGYRSLDTNLIVMYDSNTLLMDSLFGIKYNLAKSNPNKFGFKKIGTKGSYSLYENEYALPLGVLTDNGIFNKKNTNNQTTLFQHLSGLKEPIYKFTGLQEISRKNMQIREDGDFTYFSEESNRESQSITWEAKVPEKTQAYINLDTGSPDRMREANVEVKVNGRKTSNNLVNTGNFYDIGHYEKETKVNVTVTFSGQSVIRLVRPSVLLLQTDQLAKSVKRIKEKAVNFEVNGNRAQANVSLEKDQVVFTSIPYDQGWKATLDGKPLKVKSVQNALVAFNVPKGKHSIRLTYYPKGMHIGFLLFVSCTLIFSIYAYWSRKKSRELGQEEKK